MSDNKSYTINGGLAVYDGVNSQLRNFRASTSLDGQTTLMDMNLFAFPTVVCGVIPSTTANTLASITATNDGSSVSLAVNPQVTPLTSAAPTAASVGVASAQALAANTSRKHLVLVNTSANTISLGFGANAAVLASGITLLANGGSYEMSAQLGNLNKSAINAIASGAASNLSIQEDN